MVCLQPLLLWGLAGIGIPLAIHLLSRHHTPVMHWAAMQLLRQAVTTRSRRIKLEDVFLLLLRCLAIACLAVALARPVLPTWQSSAKAMSGSAPGTVIALDCSYSMGYHAGVSARFDRGVKLVRDVLQNAPAGMRLTVLLLGRRPRLLYKSLNSNPAEVSALLGKTEILPEPLALESNLEAVQAALQDMDVPERECYLVTDAQRLDWGDLSRAARTCLNSIAGLARVFLLPCGDEGQENLAVTELRPLSGHLIKGEMVRLLAEVWNSGSQTQNNVKVRLALEDTVVDEKTVTVGPQQTVPVFLYARLKQSGPVRALASISEDALALDNTRCAILHVRDTLKILCVDGSLGLSGFAPDSRYLVVAFSPGKVKSASARGLEVERVSRPQFDNVRLFDYQAVALVNVPELPPSALNALRDYVLWGGGLLVFAGELQSAELLNRSFGKAGLLPGELSAPVGNAVKQDSALALEVLSGDAAWGGAGGGALAQNLRALPKEMLSEALFYRRFPVKLAPGAREILRFENNGGVLLAEQDVGRGKVLFFNCTADEQWTNLPKTTLFPILLHQAVTELTQQESERAFTVGEPINAALPAELVAEQAILTDPKGESTTLKISSAEGRRSVSYPKTDWPGTYTLQPGNKAGLAKTAAAKAAALSAPAAMKFAVNVDTKESAVACLQGPALAAALKDLPIQIVEGGAGTLSETLQQARTGLPLWRPLLITALLFFLLEFVLSHRFSRLKAAGRGLLTSSSPAREIEN